MGLLKDTSFASITKIITLVVGIGITSANAWLLGPEGRGQLAIYSMFGLLLALASSGGIEMASGYYAGTKKHPLSNILLGTGLIIFISTALAAIIALVLWRWKPSFLKDTENLGIIFSVLYVPGLLLFTTLWYIHSALGNTKSFSLGHLFSQTITLIAILLLCRHSGNSSYAMLAYVAGLFMSGFFLIITLIKTQPLTSLEHSWNCTKDLYRYGFKYYFGRVAEFFNVQIGTLVIIFFGSTMEIGYFAAAITLTGRLAILPETLNSVLFSRIVKGQHASIELTARLIRLTFWATALTAAILAIFCQPLVKLLLSPKFLTVVVPIWIMLPGMVVRCCSKLLGLFYNGVGTPEINSVSLVSAIIVNVLLIYFLLPTYGVVGAAIASTCGNLIDGMVLLLYYRFRFKYSLILLRPKFGDFGDMRLLLSRYLHKQEAVQ